MMLCGAVQAVAADAEPVGRLSFQRARRKFLSLIRRNPPKQQKPPGNDVDMLVPDGERAGFLFWSISLICESEEEFS